MKKRQKVRKKSIYESDEGEVVFGYPVAEFLTIANNPSRNKEDWLVNLGLKGLIARRKVMLDPETNIYVLTSTR